MQGVDLEKAAHAACEAADRARAETLPRFRAVEVRQKPDGTPVTEADLAAERAIRAHLERATPGYAILGEEFGAEGDGDGPRWVIDPIDGTVGFARGIPLYSTLIALVVEAEPVLGLIDLPTLGERYLGWKGAGCRRNGAPVRASQETDLRRALISHADPVYFDVSGERAALERMLREIPRLRGYTDGFGHAQVVAGGIDAMVELDCAAWDLAATRALIPEAGGRCIPVGSGDRSGLVFGAPALVEQLADFLSCS